MPKIVIANDAKHYAEDNVSNDKIWNIRFNMPLDEKYIYSNISVYDKEFGTLHPVDLNLDKNNNSVEVIPLNPYIDGVTYEMKINGSIKSETGEFNSKSVNFLFTIKGKKTRSFKKTYLSANGIADSMYASGSYSNEAINEKVDELNKKENQILEEILKEGMTDFEKELVIHDYIVKNAQWDWVENFENVRVVPFKTTAYSLIVDGRATKEGYVEAVQRLMNKVGIECITVNGFGTSENGEIVKHAWNIVKIQGEYYHVDVMWDDSNSTNDEDRIYYTYLNLSDEIIQKDHSWDKDIYPTCESSEYFSLNMDLHEYDDEENLFKFVSGKEEVSRAIEEALDNNQEKLRLKVLNFEEDILQMLRQKKLSGCSVKESKRDIVGVKYIDIIFKYNNED